MYSQLQLCGAGMERKKKKKKQKRDLNSFFYIIGNNFPSRRGFSFFFLWDAGMGEEKPMEEAKHLTGEMPTMGRKRGVLGCGNARFYSQRTTAPKKPACKEELSKSRSGAFSPFLRDEHCICMCIEVCGSSLSLGLHLF